MKTILLTFFIVLLISCSDTFAQAKEEYRCIPCGYDCDQKVFSAPGKCGDCNMTLVRASTIGKTRSIKPADICSYIESHPNTILLDVRTKNEFEGKGNPNFGSLKGAINMPVQELEQRIAELSAYKNKEIIVYCSHSHRSPRAAYLLSQHGFTKVINMEGGMSTVKDKECVN